MQQDVGVSSGCPVIDWVAIDIDTDIDIGTKALNPKTLIADSFGKSSCHHKCWKLDNLKMRIIYNHAFKNYLQANSKTLSHVSKCRNLIFGLRRYVSYY